ncbi:myotubularin-related protein 14 isoform X1 [Schistocerca americana]|uniref:myotubularin-related protein 14 isoform X1 n=1 Tax=Schistocerca americana TaxID=7009 RepID=UPI001F4FB840|nr:myotubularin-related protein 14 isoform X1 [Schistocerca americana]
MDYIRPLELQQLLEYFSKNTYRARESDPKSQEILQKCLKLIELDYHYIVISNAGGELSAHYPSQLIILEYEHSQSCSTSANGVTQNSTIYESLYDSAKLRDLIGKARFARCRARFPLPVILYHGKNICRSATLSGGPEIYGRSGLDYLFSGSENAGDDFTYDEVDQPPQSQSDWQLFDRVRSQDIRLLRALNVGTIVDFMVEKKKVKFGVNVTSSEKVDKENRYSDFTIISLPYPGCEFFKEYRDNNYVAKGLVFDWSQAHVDASIGVPDDQVSSQLKVEWNNYKEWDLVRLTQNYLKLLLRYLQDNNTGLLIHCISGWDRTPLFVSLLRLSLWADGVIHQSLNPYQILYLTIAYDWMLFGHNLEDRLSKGEEIFFFCFHFLKHMLSEEFSVLSTKPKIKNIVMRNDSDLHLDGVLFEAECPVSCQGSNISLNSSCSSQSSKSQDNPPVYFHTLPDSSEDSSSGMSQPQWPQAQYHVSQMPEQPPRSPHQSRTSPVAVPVSSRFRQRNDSSSSLSTGSWQLISGTGSLRGSATSTVDTSSLLAAPQTGNQPPLYEETTSADSSTTIIDDDCFSVSVSSDTSLRREKLQTVRSLFYTAYCSTIGFKFKNGSDSGLGSLLGNIAEKVGILSAQRTSL